MTCFKEGWYGLIGWIITIIVVVIAFVWWICTALFIAYFLTLMGCLIIGGLIRLWNKIKGGE